MRERNVVIRLSLKDGEKVENRLKKLGTRGQAALAKVERASKPASKGLLVLNKASGQVQAGMAGLAGRAGGLGNVMGALGPAGLVVAAGFGAAAIAMGLAIVAAREAVASFSELANTAEKLGLATEALQELRFAAEQTGVSAGNMDTAIQRFTRRLAEAQVGTGELLPELERYNIAIRDSEGRNRSATDVLADYADTVAGVTGDQERLRLTVKAFDQEGAGLVKLLAEGADGMDAYAARAREAGIVIDDHIVQKARETGDELNLLEQRNKALMDQIGIFFSDWLINLEEVKGDILKAINEILDAFRSADDISSTGLDAQIEKLGDQMRELDVQAAQFREQIAGLSEHGFGIRRSELERGLERALKAYEVADERLQTLLQRQKDLASSDRANSSPRSGLSIDVNGSPAAKVIADLQKQITALNSTDFSAAFGANLDKAKLGRNDVFSGDGSGGEIFRLTAELHKARKAQQDLTKSKARAKSITQQVMTVEEKRNALLAEAEGLLKSGAITEETKARLDKDLADQRLADATDFSSGVERAFKTMEESAKSAADVAEDAITSAFDGASDALTDFIKTGELDLGSFRDIAIKIFADIAIQQARTQLVKPLLSALGLFETGAAFSGGHVIPHAAGGVVSKPTFFPMAKGNIGLMGEAGPEAIMPLTRTPDGHLGVRAVQQANAAAGAVIIHNSPVITINGRGGGSAGGGDQASDRQLAEQITDLMDRNLRAMVDEQLERHLRPGGMMNFFGDSRNGIAG